MWNEWIHDIGGIIHDNSDHINGSGEVIVIRRINFVSVVGEARAGAEPGLRALYADGSARRCLLHPPYWVVDVRDKPTVYPIIYAMFMRIEASAPDWAAARQRRRACPCAARPIGAALTKASLYSSSTDSIEDPSLFLKNSWYQNDTQTMGFRPFIGTLFFVTP